MLRLEARLTTVRTLAFSPDNRYLLAVGVKPGLGGLLRFSRFALYDLTDLTATPTLRIDVGLDPIAGFFLPDGRALGVDDRGSWIAVPVGNEKATRLLIEDPYRYHPVAVSPGGGWVVLINRRSYLCVSLCAPGERSISRESHFGSQAEVAGAAFSPDGSRLAVGYDIPNGSHRPDGVIYQTATGQEVRHLARRRDALRGLAWSPDGRFIAALTAGGLQVFDADTGALRGTREEFPTRVTSSAFHPGGGFFVTADETGQVQFWDTADRGEWAPARTLDWGVGSIQALAFSPDGTLGAVAGRHGEVVVWDADE
jgi:WD40 repeat protein